jgi:ribonucleoside-diphosphate reductase beta chain
MALTAHEIVEKRRVFNGPRDTYRGITPVRYPWAKEIWKGMLSNTWFPEEINLTGDALAYSQLTEGNRRAYDRSLAFLAHLDSIQLHNLAANIAPIITSPEIESCINRQIFEENLHVESYSVLIEAVSRNPEEIYFMPLHDSLLQAKNDAITAQSRLLETDNTEKNILLACVSNIILEGIYFYSGFATFYTLARAGLMPQSSSMIKYINRDELTHLYLFTNMIQEASREFGISLKSIEADIHDLMRASVDLEVAWGSYVIEDGVLGLTPNLVRAYIEFLANQRLSAIGVANLYEVRPHPLKWIEEFSSVNNSSTAFFERRPTDYQKGVNLW